MLEAILHGKLTREEERMEDLLTSNTFGLMKYLPHEMVLTPFLSQAKNPFTKHVLADWLGDVFLVEHLRFWPTLSYPCCLACEPDVDIMFNNEDGSKTRLLIEAKYGSGKSSWATEGETRPNDQLAREFDNLRFISDQQRVSRYAVIYLTTDFSCPTGELKDSVREYRNKRGTDPNLYWLSWRVLFDTLEVEDSKDSTILHDIRELILRLHLTMFRQLRFEDVRPLEWSFARARRSWQWIATGPDWQFKKQQTLWSWSPIPSSKLWTFTR